MILGFVRKLPSYNKTFAIFLIGCAWFRLLAYVTTLINLMSTSRFGEHLVMIVAGVIISTYACSKYIDNRDADLLGEPIKNLKEV